MWRAICSKRVCPLVRFARSTLSARLRDTVDLQKAAAELDSYTGNVWTHIISLKREDAARLGYDHARA